MQSRMLALMKKKNNNNNNNGYPNIYCHADFNMQYCN